MGTCRITKLKPPCDYIVEGIAKIWLLDYDDFVAFRFRGQDLYNNCFVTDIIKTGNYIELDAPNMVAKYSSSGKYVHTLESFVGDLTSEVMASLHLGTKRRFIVVFVGKNNKYYTFGYEAGATLSYTNQTAEGFGSTVILNAASEYPLFETSEKALANNEIKYKFYPDFNNGVCIKALGYEYKVDFNNGAFCEVI